MKNEKGDLRICWEETVDLDVVEGTSGDGVDGRSSRGRHECK